MLRGMAEQKAWLWMVVTLAIFCFALMLFSGCGGGGGGGAQPSPPDGGPPPEPQQDTNPPKITDVQVNPQNLPRFTGGEVRISAQVSDPSGVAEVWAEVEKPDGTEEKMTMNLQGGVYQGKITAFANTRSDGQVETYKVWVRAKDGKGNETAKPGEPKDGVSFKVPAPSRPPDEPKDF